jgi:cell division protein FtsW (lipid II flippase)
MKTQNFANHARLIFMFHGVLAFLIVASLIGACVNLAKSWGDPSLCYSSSLLVITFLSLAILFVFTRQFGTMAQDRAIRAEENLRHFAMTGKLFDSRLTIRQIIGLRFAPDDEFLALAKRAVDEKLSEKAIKMAIKNWKADTYRV